MSALSPTIEQYNSLQPQTTGRHVPSLDIATYFQIAADLNQVECMSKGSITAFSIEDVKLLHL
jgi:hypothetical protein